VALLLTAPWSSSPGFLQRAEAALTPPAGTVLHMKWQLTTTSTDPPARSHTSRARCGSTKRRRTGTAHS
jgi:hypothetical protein